MLNVICLEDEAFYQMIETVLERVNKNYKNEESEWLTTDQAMELLAIKSKTTLQKLRDQGKISFTMPSRKIILYQRSSIMKYLEDHIYKSF